MVAPQNRGVGGLKFRRQYPIGRYSVDFFCFERNFALELDGSVHSQPTQARLDKAKDAYLASRGIRVLRVANGWVIEDPEGFIEKIKASVPSPGPGRRDHPLPRERARRNGTPEAVP